MEKGFYSFNPKRDNERVSDCGAIDLNQAYIHGAIPANLGAIPLEYNGIDEPASIAGRPRDAFDEIAMRKSYRDYESNYNKKEK